jgi:hypothetical protein
MYNSERKFIIVKQSGKLKKFKFPASGHHFNFARDLGFDFFRDVVETGTIVDKQIKIMECKVKSHMERRIHKSWLSEGYMKGRELESMLMYKVKGLRDGD